MTNEEKLAEEWIKEHSGLIGSYKFVKYDYDSLKQAFLAGLKAGKDMAEADIVTVAYMQGAERYKPKWHKVADGDLPKENYFVLVLNKRTGYEIARRVPFEEYYLDNWVTIDNRSLIQTKNNQTVIAWCEIPKYTEE